MTKGHIRVVAAVLARDGRYLVCRRAAHKRHGDLWEFPGGKVHEGESRAEAVGRELAEELQLETSAVGDVLLFAADDGSPYLIEFIETRAEGTPVLHEHSEVGWFTPAEMAELPLAPADARFATWLREQSTRA